MGKGQPGEANPNWKGGRTTDPRGYVLIKRPDHPAADVRGYVYEHRLVAEEHLGRYLLPTEEVHHKNENPSDNAWSNLKVTGSHAEHALEHRKRADLRLPGAPNPEVVCDCGCGGAFPRYDGQGRPRRFLPSHNMRVRGY